MSATRIPLFLVKQALSCSAAAIRRRQALRDALDLAGDDTYLRRAIFEVDSAAAKAGAVPFYCAPQAIGYGG